MRIYLDNCCYNRLFDEKSQERVQAESDAIKNILIRSKELDNIVIGSEILISEIDRIKDTGKKLSVISLYTQVVTEMININAEIFEYAKNLMEQANIKQMDALHLSCALISNADVFLTVDDKLIKACKSLNLKMQVINPVILEGDSL